MWACVHIHSTCTHSSKNAHHVSTPCIYLYICIYMYTHAYITHTCVDLCMLLSTRHTQACMHRHICISNSEVLLLFPIQYHPKFICTNQTKHKQQHLVGNGEGDIPFLACCECFVTISAKSVCMGEQDQVLSLWGLEARNRELSINQISGPLGLWAIGHFRSLSP